MSPREAARVLLLDASGRVLLLWHSPVDGSAHWAPPGGGIDPGETPVVAALRELREEIGVVDVALSRPVWLWSHGYRRQGVDIEQREHLFVAPFTGVLGSGIASMLEDEGISTQRWFTVAELLAEPAEVWPHGLATSLAGLTDLAPPEPTDLGFTA